MKNLTVSQESSGHAAIVASPDRTRLSLLIRRRVRVAASLLILPLLAVAQQPSKPAAAAPPASWKELKFPALKEIQLPKVEKTTLPNGMKVYLLENHELPLVRGSALIRTGNLFDTADKVGLASVTGETIRSGGTSKLSGDQIDEQLENIAADVESEIGESSGTVSFSTLKERTDEVLAIFHDVLTDPAFRQDKIDLWKAQTNSGIERRNDEPMGITSREFANIVYGRNNSYGWMMEHATVNNIKRDDIVAFYKRYYFPANIILSVQGDFSAPEMKAKIEKLFGTWTYTQPKVPPFPKVDNQAKPGIYVATKTDVTQSSFVMGHLGGMFIDKDYPALEVMADILGGGFHSRLFQEVRSKLGYAYDVGAGWGASYDHPGMFEIEGSTKSPTTVETLKAIDVEVKKIRGVEVTDEELQSAKDTVLNGFIFAFDTPSKTLNRMVRYDYYGYPDDFIFQYQKAIGQVTRADVLRVAKQYVAPDKFVIVVTGNPKDFGASLNTLELPVNNIDLSIPEGKAPAK
jgi:zinc protease